MEKKKIDKGIAVVYYDGDNDKFCFGIISDNKLIFKGEWESELDRDEMVEKINLYGVDLIGKMPYRNHFEYDAREFFNDYRKFYRMMLEGVMVDVFGGFELETMITL